MPEGTQNAHPMEGLGAARPAEFCSTMARGFGGPQSVCPRDVLDGGPLAQSRHARCGRIRLSYFSLPAIRKQKPRRYGGRCRFEEITKSTCVPFSTLPHSRQMVLEW